MRFVAAIVAFLIPFSPMIPSARAQSAYDESEAGRFRVEFDPGNRVELGVCVMAHTDSGETSAGSAFHFSLTRRRQGNDLDEAWKLETHLLDSFAGRVGPRGNRRPYLDVQGLHGTYIRFSSDPHLTLPTTEPRYIWFPFSPGVTVGALRFQQGLADAWELSVVDAGLILDAARSPAPGTRAWFGVSGEYALTRYGRPTEPLTVEQVLSPFGTGIAGFSYEWGGGLYAVSADAAFGTQWSTHRGWSLHGEGAARVSATPIAINDRPLVLFAEARASLTEDETGLQTGPVVAISGLSIGFDKD